MALDQAFIGRIYPPSPPYEVGREKIAEFANAIGDPNPVYRDREAARSAGYDDVIAPPTFAIILALRAHQALIDDPELGLDYSRLVHGEHNFTYHHPIRAGDQLMAVLHVDNISHRVGNDFLALRAEISTEDGELLITSRATLVVRGAQDSANTHERQP